MPGTLGIVLSVSLAATVLAVFIAVIVVKCYINWKKQHTKDLRLAESAVQQLVLSSQPVDFVPLLLQDRLEEEEEDDIFDSAFMNVYISGTSSEDLCDQTRNNQTNWKEPKIHPPLKRLDSASSVLDRYGQRVPVRNKPKSTKRGESMFFDDSDSCHTSADESLAQRCYSAGANSRPRKNSIGLRTRSDSINSLSRESLAGDSTLPDHVPHMRKSVVSTVDTNAPRPKIEKARKHSTSEISYADKKPARKTSRVPQKRGNVIFKVTYSKDQHTLELHLINATELPIRHGRLLDSFARLSLKTPSKRRRFQSKVIKKTCNPIFDEKFVFDSVYFSELQQAHLKIKLMDRFGVSRCDTIGEVVVALYDENIMRGDNVIRGLIEKAGKKQCAGELLVSMCHEATSSHLKVTIMKLKGLPKSIKSPSVALELTHKDEILQKYQAKSKKKSLAFEEEFSFEVATNSSCTLENFGVQFTVFQHDFMRGNEVVGHVRVGMDAPLQSEVMHWKAVVLSPHKPITEWHKLHAPQ